jgi:hypothetical protein
MTERRDLDRLVSELARWHEQGLERSTQEVAASERRFLDALEREARLSRPEAGRSWGIALGRLTFVGQAAAAAAIAVGVGVGVARLGVRKGPASPNLDILPEAAVTTSSARGATSTAPVTGDPCAHPIRAAGTDPMIDDFEDGDSLVSRREGRYGAWMLFKDGDPAGGLPLLAPVRRVPPTARNRKALHATGGELRDWGATLQLDFRPACYDASAYGGIAFSAQGPGRLYVGVREVRVVPTQWGGTCAEHCYDAHQKKVDLGTTWHHYRVPWSELHQLGYQSPPLDPTRIHDLAFLVQPADTPFDLWIDDVSFLAQPSPTDMRSEVGDSRPIAR